MQSLRYLYRIGNGPSSSHTMGPIAAVKRFLKDHPEFGQETLEWLECSFSAGEVYKKSSPDILFR